MHNVTSRWKSRRAVAVVTCRALTTLIWCSSARVWTQWWNRELTLSWMRWTSSPSTLSNLDSKYSRFTWTKGDDQKKTVEVQRRGGDQSAWLKISLHPQQIKQYYEAEQLHNQCKLCHMTPYRVLCIICAAFVWTFWFAPSKHFLFFSVNYVTSTTTNHRTCKFLLTVFNSQI